MSLAVAPARRGLPGFTPGDASSFSFHQLALLLDRFFADAPPVGTAVEPGLERVRFRALDSLAFPPADIAEAAVISASDERAVVRLTVTFLGLYGPSSPMPPGLTERLLHDDEGGPALRGFLDLFNHRLVSLLHRAWTKYRYPLRFRGFERDPISTAVVALAGYPRSASANTVLCWERLLPFAGMLALPCASPAVVTTVLRHYFGDAFRIEEGVERIVPIPPEQRHRLGRVANGLGRSWTLGKHVRDVSGKCRVWIGPVSRDRLDAFAAGGADHKALFTLVRVLLRDSLLFDVRVLLTPDALDAWRLGQRTLPLGRLLWLGRPDPLADGVPLAEAA